MRNTVLALLFVVSASVVGMKAQISGEMELIRINPALQDWRVDRIRCGDYFYLIEHLGISPPGPRVGLVAKSATGNSAFLILKSKYKTILEDKITNPTAELVLRNARAMGLLDPGTKIPVLALRPSDVESVIVRISKPDYYQATKCLPPPAEK